jgi:hypothetical protein
MSELRADPRTNHRVAYFNGNIVPERSLPGPLPGPVTRLLSEAYARDVGCDFVAQYLRHLG